DDIGKAKPSVYDLPPEARNIVAAVCSQTVRSIVSDHFREYDKWPWLRISSLEKQLQDHPSFVVGEALFLILAAFSFLHAICESRDGEFRRLKLIWVATFIVGTVNDYIFMLLPVVDNFWQAQAVLMLTPRMPLYIPCVYNAFMYWPTVAAARVFCHRRCPIAEASLAGLLAGLFYAPYDMCGAKFLWWTWHDTDPGVALRWLGVPGGSTAWTLTFTFCFSLLLRWGSDAGWGMLRSLALACWSTPLMLVVLNVCTGLGWDRIGMPGPRTVLATALLFSAICVWKPGLKVWPQRSATMHLFEPEHWSVRFAMVGYFFALILIGSAFSPENQVSTGVHQEFGPCDATDIDLLGLERKRYICRERFPQDYFNLDCHGPTKDQELAEISSCFSTVQCMKIWGGRCKMGTCIARAIYDRQCCLLVHHMRPAPCSLRALAWGLDHNQHFRCLAAFLGSGCPIKKPGRDAAAKWRAAFPTTVAAATCEGFTFGRSEPADAEGAREVTMHWASHVPRPKPGPDCQDFRKLNRAAAKSGIRHARDLAEFRKSTDIKLVPPGPLGVLPKVIPSDVIPSFAYGTKSRPSTPITHVIGNQYATESEEALAVHYRVLEENQQKQERRLIKLTKASKERIHEARQRMKEWRNPQEPKEPFKLTKFKKVTSKLKLPGGLRECASAPALQRLPDEQPEALAHTVPVAQEVPEE
ncbi:cfap77, partial [Symbiodinium microadriaticum]